MVNRLANGIVWLVKTAAELVAIAAFSVVAFFVVAATFAWFLTPWQRRKIRERYRQAESHQKAEDLRRRVAEAKAQRDAEEAYRAVAARAAARRTTEDA